MTVESAPSGTITPLHPERRVTGVNVVMNNGDVVFYPGDYFTFAEAKTGALIIGPYIYGGGPAQEALVAPGLWRSAAKVRSEGTDPPRGAPSGAWLENRLHEWCPELKANGITSVDLMWVEEKVHDAIKRVVREFANECIATKNAGARR